MRNCTRRFRYIFILQYVVYSAASLLSFSLIIIGNIYIADYLDRRVRKVTVSTGIITTVAGTGSNIYSGDNGEATSAGLSGPQGVAVDTSGKSTSITIKILCSVAFLQPLPLHHSRQHVYR